MYQGVWGTPSHPRADAQFLEARLNGNEKDPHSHHEQFIGQLQLNLALILMFDLTYCVTGDEEAEMYDQLPPLIAKRLLGRVVEKIDLDRDGFVSRDELLEWIERLTKE